MCLGNTVFEVLHVKMSCCCCSVTVSCLTLCDCSMPCFPVLHYPPVQFSLVAQTCLTLFNPMDYSTPGFPVQHQLPVLVQTHVHCVVMPSNHLILCHSLLLLPSIFASIRVFSKQSVLHTRWPKYRSFSFSISPSNEDERRAQTKPCVHQEPGERSSDPTGD